MLSVHPIVARLPEISPDRRAALKADIGAVGQKVPIILVDGLVWDGRAKVSICRELSITPWVVPLRGVGTIEIYLTANMHRAGAPMSDQRRVLVDVLAQINAPDQIAAAAQRRSAWLRKARAEFQVSERGARQACAVCGSYAEFVHAHHSFPLALQFECGLVEAVHDHDWLCPVHHQKVHVLLSGYLLGTRELDFLDNIPDSDQQEWLTIEGVAQKGIRICCEEIGPVGVDPRVGRFDPPFAMYIANNQHHIYPWRGPA